MTLTVGDQRVLATASGSVVVVAVVDLTSIGQPSSLLAALAGQSRAPDVTIAVLGPKTPVVAGQVDLQFRLPLTPGRRLRPGDAVRAALAALDAGDLDPVPDPPSDAALPPPQRAPARTWLWLLDSAGIPRPDVLERLLDVVLSSPSVGVAGCSVAGPGGTLLAAGATMTRLGARHTGLEPGEVDQGQHDARDDVMGVPASGSLVRRDVWDVLGGPDPALRADGDLDLGRRARLAGHRVVVVRAARLTALSTTDTTWWVRRRDAVHRRLVDAPLVALPLVLLGILVAAPVRALALLASRRPLAAAADLGALGAVLARADHVVIARMRARRTANAPRSALRPLLAPLRDAARASLTRGVHAWDAVRPARPHRDPVDVGGIGRRTLTHPATWVALALAACSAVAARSLIGAGATTSPVLAPVGDTAGLLGRVGSSWRPDGLGAPGPAATADVLLAAASAVVAPLGIAAPVVLDASLLAAPALAALTAWLAARRLSASRWVQAMAALGFGAGAPLLLAGSTGRVGVALALVVLPLLALALHSCVRPPGGGPAPAAAGAAATVVVAGAPSLAPPLLAAVLATGAAALVAGAGRRVVGALAVALVVPVMLLAPWWWPLARDGDLAALLAGAGGVAGAASAVMGSATAAATTVAAAVAAGLTAVIVVAAVAAALADPRPHVRRVGGIAAVTVLAVGCWLVAASAAGWDVDPTGPAGLALAAGVAALAGRADGARARLRARASRPAHAGAAALVAGALIACALPVAAVTVTGPSVVGDQAVARTTADLLGPVPAGETAAPTAARALVLDVATAGDVRWRYLRAAGPRQGDTGVGDRGVGDTGVGDGATLPGEQRLSVAVARLVAGRADDLRPVLEDLGVGTVHLAGADSAADATERVLATLATAPGLVQVSGEDGATWRVEPSPGSDLARPAAVRVLSPTGEAAAAGGWDPASSRSVATTLEPDAGRRLLVLAELADPGWRASVDGAALEPTTHRGWAQAFVVTPGAGGLLVEHVDDDATAVRVAAAVGVLVLLVVLVPGRPSSPGPRRVDLPVPRTRAQRLRPGVAIAAVACSLAAAGVAGQPAPSATDDGDPVALPAAGGTVAACPGPETVASVEGATSVGAPAPAVLTVLAAGPGAATGTGAAAGTGAAEGTGAVQPPTRVTGGDAGAGQTAVDLPGGVAGRAGSGSSSTTAPGGWVLGQDWVNAPGALAGLQTTLAVQGDLRGLAASACTPAATQTWLVGGASTPERRGRLLLSNPGTQPAVVDVSVLGGTGPVQTLGATGVVVPPGGQAPLLLDAIAPDVEAPVVGIAARSGAVSAVLHDSWLRGLVPGGTDDVSPAAPPAAVQVVPGVLGGREVEQGLVRVAVPGDEDAVVTVDLVGGEGPAPEQRALTVSAGSVVDVPLDDLGAGVWTATVRADVPVLAGALTVVATPEPGRDAPRDLAWVPSATALAGTVALPPVPAPVSARLVLADAADAGGSPGVEPSVALRSRDADGTLGAVQAIAVPTGEQVVVDLPAGYPGGVAEVIAGDVVASLVLGTLLGDGPVLSVVPVLPGAVAEPPLTVRPAR